jgi:hypothetical protein
LTWPPLMLELEVLNGATHAISGAETRLRYDTATNTSDKWQNQDVRVVCDVATLDSALQNS